MLSLTRPAATAALRQAPGIKRNWLTAVCARGHDIRRSFSSVDDQDQDLLISKSDGLLTIKLNRPKKLNSMNQQITRALASTLDAAAMDPDVRMVLYVAYRF